MLLKFSSRHRSTCCIQISRNVDDGKSAKSCIAYLTKTNKISPGSSSVATVRIVPTICQGPTVYSLSLNMAPHHLSFPSILLHRHHIPFYHSPSMFTNKAVIMTRLLWMLSVYVASKLWTVKFHAVILGRLFTHRTLWPWSASNTRQ